VTEVASIALLTVSILLSLSRRTVEQAAFGAGPPVDLVRFDFAQACVAMKEYVPFRRHDMVTDQRTDFRENAVFCWSS